MSPAPSDTTVQHPAAPAAAARGLAPPASPFAAHTGPHEAARTGRGPLLAAPPGAPRSLDRALARDWDRGGLVRLSPGVYCPADLWRGLAPWDRFSLCAAAVAQTRPDTVFTGTTAAHLLGLPLAEVPLDLQTRAASPGHHGRAPLVRHHASPALVDRGVPTPPGRAPRWNPLTAPGDAAVVVELHLADGTFLGAANADGPASVHLQVAAGLPLRESTPVLDRLALTCRAPSSRWAEQHAHLPRSRAARERFARACAFADARAESPGESLSRVLIDELGFAPPVLQHRLHGADGRAVGRVDFWWPEVRVAGEFDGITKYDVGLHDSEEARRRSIRAEKEREVRLLRSVGGVARWTWADLRAPARLEAELLRQGVPRRRR